MPASKRTNPWPPVFETIYTMPRRIRPALIDFALSDPRHSDLINTFPVAAVILSEKRGAPAMRGEALWQVARGAGLKAIAKALDIPSWTRRITPQAAATPISPQLTHAPDCHLIAGLARRMPIEPSQQRTWLNNLNRAMAYEDETFRRWLILRAPLAGHILGPFIDLVAAYKFYSENTKHDASKHLPATWTHRMAWPETLANIHMWLRAAAVQALWQGSGLNDASACPIQRGRYKIRPILTPDALEAAADRLDNCLRTYWLPVLTGTSNIFIIEGPRSSCAAFDVRRRENGPAIVEMKSRRNRRAPRNLHEVAQHWVESGMEGAPRPVSNPKSLGSCSAPWHALWRPFLDAHSDGRLFEGRNARFPRVGLLHTDLSVLERK